MTLPTIIMKKEILNYRIVKLIGKGGMGSVYLAEHKTISSQKAAIKVINADMVNDFTRERLKEEAKHLAELHHANIVSLFDFHADEEGNIYLIMSLAEGKNLEDYINEDSGLIVEDKIFPIFAPILDAVGYAHKHGVIHRDIKPSNIMITPEGAVQVLDFGIATIVKQNGDEEDALIMGTPSYMSPEQVKGDKVDERSDIYSLGVMLHQMLTGNPPYDTTTLTEVEINQKVVEEPLPRLKSYYKYVSDRVQKVVDKATAKNPDDRYQTCEEFKKALHKAIYPPKIPMWAKITTAIASVVIIVGAFSIWDFNRTKVAYFKDYTEQWGVPIGVGKISSSDAKHTHRMYRFTSKRGKLLNVAHVNSLGLIIDDGESERKDRPVNQDFYYREDGKLSHVKVKNSAGAVSYVMSYNDKLNTMVYQFDDEHGTERVMANSTVGYTAVDDMSASKGRISRWWIDYDDKGYTKSIRFAGLDNSPVPDENGIYGISYIRDDSGRPTEIIYMAENGEIKPTKWGLAKKRMKYDDADNLVEVRYLTYDDQPIPDSEGGPLVYTISYDKFGNATEALHLDGEGNLMVPKRNGIAGVQTEYDDKGFIKTQTYLGPDRQPMIQASSGFAIAKTECDENGFFNSCRFYDAEGKPIISKNGAHRYEIKNDSIGNTIERWSYDLDDKLSLNSDGFCGEITEWGPNGYFVKTVYYDDSKKPTILKDGYAGLRATYDDKNMVKSVTYLNDKEEPAPMRDGITRVNYQYDKRGNRIRYSYTDASGDSLINCNKGYAEEVSVYDENGLITETSYLTASGHLTVNPDDKYAKVVYTYDENGNMNSSRYFGKDGKPVIIDGYIGVDYINDTSGNTLSSKHIGMDGRLAEGRLEGKYEYDRNGNVTTFAVYNRHGEPALNKNDIHKITYKYNSHNQQIEEACFDCSGNPTIDSKTGASIVKYEYDNSGNSIRTIYLGTDGKPIKNRDGYSSSKQEYDAFGNVIKQFFYDTNSQLCDISDYIPIGICEYDTWGRMTYIASKDKHDKFYVNPNFNFAIKRMEYDRHDNLTKESYFDANDKPMMGGEDNVHIKTSEYNPKDQLIAEAYYDTNNNPCLINGLAKITYKYDEDGNVTEAQCFGTTGSPKACDGGWQKVTFTYTEDGEPQGKKYYAANGDLIHTFVRKNGEWVRVVDWRADIRELNASLPIEMGGGLILLRATITGSSSCEFVIRVPMRASEMSSEAKKEAKKMARNAAEMFAEQINYAARVTARFVDSQGNSICSATY